MDFYHFADEAAVLRESQKVLSKILSDKSYINPQKISLLLSEYEKKQTKLDAQLQKSIKSQIDSIQNSKQSVQAANNWMKQATQKTQYLKQIWNDQYSFHQLMQDIASLNIYENNIGKVIEQLTYFIDMESQMNKLQKLAEDQAQHLTVNLKLLNLIALRDALSEDSAWKKQAAMMRQQFVKVDNFQIAFYDRICQNFSNCIKNAKQNPKGLAMAVKVVEAYDKFMEQKGRQKEMRYRVIEMIKDSIDNKFSENLQGEDDLIGVIQNSKFATTDLVDVADYVVPCFPKDFPIMQIYQKQYQENIEKLIIPYFDQIEEDNQYGNLVALFGWIDDYETLLSRAGLDSTNLVSLKSKVKLLMPNFIDHNQKIVYDYITRCVEEDKKNYNEKFYEEIIRDQGDLISFFPSDIFRFINQEAELIKDQLKGEIFVEFVRCITETLSLFQRDLTKEVLDEFEEIQNASDSRIVEYEYKLILFINNYNECLKHAGQSKQLFSEIVSEDYRSRIEKIFLNEVQRQFNSSIPKFIHLIVKIIFMNMTRQLYPSLFTQQWLSDPSRSVLSTILKTSGNEITDLERDNLIVNTIHFRMLVKQCFEYLFNSYIEQLIVTVRVIYNIHSSQTLKYCDETFTQKKLGQCKDDPKNVFNSKTKFSEAIKQDKRVYKKMMDNFSESLSNTFVDKQMNKFVLLGQLFNKKKNDFQSLMSKAAEAFPDLAADLIEVIFVVRDDIESKAALKSKKGIVIPI